MTSTPAMPDRRLPSCIPSRAGSGRRLACILLLCVSGMRVPAQADEVVAPAAPEPAVRLYNTREERRAAGVSHEITDWLTLTGLLELEYEFQRYTLHDTPSHTHDDNFSRTVQLGATVAPLEQFKGELVYEYNDETDRVAPDEAFVSFGTENLELEAGRLYIPFGVYFSRFVTGPVLEFGETRDTGLTLNWDPDDRLELAAFALRGRARETGSNNRDMAWGLSVSGSPFGFGAFGASYLSDLADSQEGFLRDVGDRYSRRVDAWSAYAVIGYDRFELTAEAVRALDTFRELDKDRDRPRAWNVELGFYPDGDFEWALRMEGSNEVEDAPHLQGGISVAWRITPDASLTLEYLRGSFRRGLGGDAHGGDADKVHQVAAQLSIGF